MQQTRYCNNVIITSVSGRKINKQKKLMKQMPPAMKHIILTDMKVSQGSAATDLREGEIFNSSFRRSFLNLTVRKI